MLKILSVALAVCSLVTVCASISAAPKNATTATSDAFGSALPDGLKAKDIIALIAPNEDISTVTLVGAKPWPHPKNSFVAIACFSKSAAGQEPSCDNFEGETRVCLGVISFNGIGSQPKLIAKSKTALDVRTEFDHSDFDLADKLAGASSDDGLLPQMYIGFDLASYKISDAETAFGLRFGWTRSYAGGGLTTNALALFKIDGNELINIFSEPVYYSENIAGEWNKVGTRKHDESEITSILLILPKKTNEYFDIVLKEKSKSKNKAQQRFSWDQANKHYLPVVDSR